MNKKKGETVNGSRRSMLLASAALLVGGITGRMTGAKASSASESDPAPPLPWKWTPLDPMEAGTLAYQSYLKFKG